MTFLVTVMDTASFVLSFVCDVGTFRFASNEMVADDQEVLGLGVGVERVVCLVLVRLIDVDQLLCNALVVVQTVGKLRNLGQDTAGSGHDEPRRTDGVGEVQRRLLRRRRLISVVGA